MKKYSFVISVVSKTLITRGLGPEPKTRGAFGSGRRALGKQTKRTAPGLVRDIKKGIAAEKSIKLNAAQLAEKLAKEGRAA